MLHVVKGGMVALGRGIPHWHTAHRLEWRLQLIHHAHTHGEWCWPITIGVPGSVESIVSARSRCRIVVIPLVWISRSLPGATRERSSVHLMCLMLSAQVEVLLQMIDL